MLLNIALSFFGTQSEIVWEQSQILTKGKLAKKHYDSVPRPQISCYTNPSEEAKKLTYFFLHSMLVCTMQKNSGHISYITFPDTYSYRAVGTRETKGLYPPPFILADHGSFYLN